MATFTLPEDATNAENKHNNVSSAYITGEIPPQQKWVFPSKTELPLKFKMPPNCAT